MIFVNIIDQLIYFTVPNVFGYIRQARIVFEFEAADRAKETVNVQAFRLNSASSMQTKLFNLI